MSQATRTFSPPEIALTGQANLYELIREDIITGRLGPNERLKVADLATRYHTSTNPVR